MAPHTPSTEAIDISMGSANGIQGARHIHTWMPMHDDDDDDETYICTVLHICTFMDLMLWP